MSRCYRNNMPGNESALGGLGFSASLTPEIARTGAIPLPGLPLLEWLTAAIASDAFKDGRRFRGIRDSCGVRAGTAVGQRAVAVKA